MLRARLEQRAAAASGSSSPVSSRASARLHLTSNAPGTQARGRGDRAAGAAQRCRRRFGSKTTGLPELERALARGQRQLALGRPTSVLELKKKPVAGLDGLEQRARRRLDRRLDALAVDRVSRLAASSTVTNAIGVRRPRRARTSRRSTPSAAAARAATRPRRRRPAPPASATGAPPRARRDRRRWPTAPPKCGPNASAVRRCPATGRSHDEVDERLAEAEQWARMARSYRAAAVPERDRAHARTSAAARASGAGGRRRRRPRALRPRRPDSSDTGVPFLERGGGIAVDLPGFGRSAKRGDLDFTIAGYDDFLERFLAHARRRARPARRARLGRRRRLAWAQRLPSASSGSSSIDACRCSPATAGTPRRARLAHGGRGLGEVAMAAPLHHALGDAGAAARRRSRTPCGSTGTRARSARSSSSTLSLAGGARGGRARPRRITCPALVVWGSADAYLDTRFARAYADALGGEPSS